MGDLYKQDDFHIENHIEGLNMRFAPGQPLSEMVRLQKEFKVFSSEHELQDSIALLNVTGASWNLRAKWYALMKWIAGLDSNQRGLKGGPAITAALQKNLESAKPMPVHFRSHDYNKDKKVLVDASGRYPIFYIKIPYLTVSLPLRARS